MQQLATSLGLSLNPSLLGGTNFAFGGAKTGFLPSIGFTALGVGDVFPVLAQSSFAATSAPLPGDGLYLLNGGGNDIRAALNYVGFAPFNSVLALDAFAAMTESVNNLIGAVDVLAAAGATQFGVANLADLSLTPAIQAVDSIAPGTAALAQLLVLDFNVKLGAAIASSAHNITLLDSYTLLNGILANPGAFGFDNVSGACTLENGGTGCADPSKYVFWDGLHPTSAVHQLAANATGAALVPLPPAVWMLVSGLIAVFAARRRLASSI